MNNILANSLHWKIFQNSPFVPQKTFGYAPQSWADGFKFQSVQPLKNEVLTRQTVREIARSPQVDVADGYLTAMAWGMQGLGVTARHARSAWGNFESIRPILSRIKEGELSRREAFDAFKNTHVPGLGPAYFTKLIYFFKPEADAFIMDQWTSKAINLLATSKLVVMDGNSVSSRNKGENYEAYCVAVVEAARNIGLSGDETEQKLFCIGSIRRKPRGPWRQYVFDNTKG